MKYHFLIINIFLGIIFLSPNNLFGNSVFNIPTPKKFVNDFADILTDAEEENLERMIVKIEKESTIQIAVVSINSLEGLTSKSFAHKLGNQWGVGQKDKNNGVVILIKPKYSYKKGEVYIAIGKGLEYKISNHQTKLIIDEILLPNFKNNYFYEGIEKAIFQIFKLSVGRNFFHHKTLNIDEYKITIIVFFIIYLSIPFMYLIYLKNKKVSEELEHFFIQGEYNLENLLKQIEKMEKKFKKKYSKFKREITKYNKLSKGNLLQYSNIIDNQLFCYLLDGRNRLVLFWKMSDIFLKVVIFFLLVIFVIFYIFLFEYFGIGKMIVGVVFSFLLIIILYGLISSILQIYLFLLRKKGKNLGALNLAIFSINSIYKKYIKKKYDYRTNSYIYYLGYQYFISNSAMTDNHGYHTGGFSGGSTGGGFGGGSFGGSGAGGSW